MRRALATLFLALAPAAHAAGSDPLLSGYGGPGDGEQALLGTTLIREAPNSSGTAGAVQTAPAPSPEEIYETPPPATPARAPDAEKKPARTKPARTKPARTKPARTKPAPRTEPAGQVGFGGTPAEPSIVAGRDLALLAAILLGAVALAGCSRRLAVRAARDRRVGGAPISLQ
jgi:hypothetical protein